MLVNFRRQVLLEFFPTEEALLRLLHTGVTEAQFDHIVFENPACLALSEHADSRPFFMGRLPLFFIFQGRLLRQRQLEGFAVSSGIIKRILQF